MKKTVAFVIIILVVAVIAGCSGSPDGFIALELTAGITETSVGTHLSDYELWSNEMCMLHQEENAPESMTVTFNGVCYTGSYVHSETQLYNNYMTHYYETPEGIEFGINADTEEVVRYQSMLSPLQGEKTRENCSRMADEIIGQLVDISQYTRSVWEDKAEKTQMYKFTYKKYVSGIETCDWLTISFSGMGEILGFECRMPGAIDLGSQDKESKMEELVEEFGSEEALAALSNKVGMIFGEEKSYEISNKCIVVLPDGSLGIVYKAKVENRKSMEDGMWAVSFPTAQILIKRT